MEKRTFCKLPPPKLEKKNQEQASQKSIGGGTISGQKVGDEGGRRGLQWIPAVNEKASDEISAHTSMFYPRDNPGFYTLGERSKGIVVGWVFEEGGEGWYESSSEGSTSAAGDEKSKVGVKGKGAGSKRKAADESSEHVWVHSRDAEDDGDEDVKMRDGSVDTEDLEGSVLVDKASS